MQKLQDVISGSGADHAVDLFAVSEEYECGYPLYTKLHGELGILVGVDLHNLDPARVAAGDVIQYGPHHTTGTAPGRPEVQRSRDGFLEHLSRKLVALYINSTGGYLEFAPAFATEWK